MTMKETMEAALVDPTDSFPLFAALPFLQSLL